MPMTHLGEVRWIKSRFSANDGNCVEMAGLADGRVAVRDSKHPDADALVFTRAELAAWIAGAKHGEFDHLAEG